MSRRRTPAVDPGWGPIVQLVPKLFIPFVGMRTMATQSNGLLSLRLLWMVFGGALFLLWVPVLLFVRELDRAIDPGLAVGIVGLVGVVFVGGLVPGPRLRLTDERSFVESFQRRMFVRLALGEAVALVAIVCAVLSASWFVYAVGFAIALTGHVRAVPGRRSVVAAQQTADDAGVDLDATRALTETRLTR